MSPVEMAFSGLAAVITGTGGWLVKTTLKHETQLTALETSLVGIHRAVEKIDSRQEELIDFLLRDKKHG